MKKYAFHCRFISIVALGLLLVIFLVRTKHQTILFDTVLMTLLVIAFLSLILWGVIVDFRHFRKNKGFVRLLPALSGIILMMIAGTLSYCNKSLLEKPTLLRVYYNGDFNGTSVDFKTDGTYVFSNCAIGCCSYLYGKYSLDENLISLDTDRLENVIISDKLEIRVDTVTIHDRIEQQAYAYQLDNSGKPIKGATRFRLTLDNRNPDLSSAFDTTAYIRNLMICEAVDFSDLISEDTSSLFEIGQDTFTLEYVAYACECPAWIITDSLEKDRYCDPYFNGYHLDPAYPELRFPVELYFGSRVRFIGRISKSFSCGTDPDFLKGENELGIGYVLRYYSYEILKPYYVMGPDDENKARAIITVE